MNNFYVYAHYKPDGNIFYVGKGYSNRAWSSKSRNNFWHNTVKKHGEYHVVLLYENLSEKEAFRLEQEEIDFWGRRINGGFLINLTDGGEGKRGYKFTESQLHTARIAAHRRMQNPVWQANIKAAREKMYKDPKWKVSNKAAREKMYKDPKWKANHQASMQTLEWKANSKAAGKKLSQDPTWRAKNKAAMQKLSQDPTWIANNKAAREKLLQDPTWRAKNKAAMQKLHQDPKWKANVKAAGERCKKEYSFVSPEGIIHHVRGLDEFCQLYGLAQSALSAVHAAKRPHHKGWTKYIPPDDNHLLN